MHIIVSETRGDKKKTQKLPKMLCNIKPKNLHGVKVDTLEGHDLHKYSIMNVGRKCTV